MNLSFVPLVFETLLRSTILAVMCGLLLWAFRVRAAETRHLIWHVVLVALLLLPVLQIVMHPQWQPSEAALQIKMVLAAYILVTFGLLARLATGLFRLRNIVRGSEFIGDAGLHRLAHEIWLENGAGLKPRVRVSGAVTVPIAVEFDDLLILLPRSWRQWDEEKLRAVMMHEMAHVSRGDPSTGFVAALATCLFWFHPLSWFLRRQLTALAEEACDEIALQSVSSPVRYAHILMDFASEVARHGGRMLESASAAVHSSRINDRLKHVFAVSGRPRESSRAMRTLLIAMLFPAIYLTAAARFESEQPQNEPENLTAEEKLLDGYLESGNGTQFTQQLVQVIEHDPDSKLAYLTWVVLQPLGQVSTPENIAAVRSGWERALAQHPNSPGAHWGLGICVERDDPVQALALFHKARELDGSADTNKYRHATAMIYSAAIMSDLHLGDPKFRLNDIAMGLNTATKLRSEMERSKDPALLSDVGTTLVALSRSPGQDAQSELGLEYLRRAVDLDLTNLKWKEALEAAQAEPARRRAFAALKQSGGGTPRAHAGSVGAA